MNINGNMHAIDDDHNMKHLGRLEKHSKIALCDISLKHQNMGDILWKTHLQNS